MLKIIDYTADEVQELMGVCDTRFEARADGLYSKHTNRKLGDNTPYLCLTLRTPAKRYHLAIHRVMYLMHYGTIPTVVDHIDGNPLNNAVSNLRAADMLTNRRNRKRNSNNLSGYKGVYKDKGKYGATCSGTYLGLYSTAEEAHAAYCAAADQLHGAFANYGS